MRRHETSRMSENDVLIELRRLRGELSDVRGEMARRQEARRSSSFRSGPVSARQIRNRVGIAMLAGLALVVGLVSWLLYWLLSHTVGVFLQDLLPHPVRITVNAFVAVLALLLQP